MTLKVGDVFKKRFFRFSKNEIESLADQVDIINQVVTGKLTSAYSYLYNGNAKFEYYLFYVSNKYESLEGIGLKLNPSLKSRSTLTMEFANCIYKEFAEDKFFDLYIELERHQCMLFQKANPPISPKNSFDPHLWKYPRNYSSNIDGKNQFVYIMKNLRNGYFKIGRSKNPFKRENVTLPKPRTT